MTTWAVPGIAEYCRKAGWRGDALATAVAVALAASNGQDHYRYNPGALALSERKGLFALLDTDHPLGPDVDLFNPQQSAIAAHAQWKVQGETWGWHLAWLSGAAAKQLDYVTASLAKAGPTQVPVSQGAFADHLQSIIHRTNAIREAGQRSRRPHE